MKILFFGDIIGKIGREALAKTLPDMVKEIDPDFILANGENLAHGLGFTGKTVLEMLDLGIDFMTSGNHTYDKEPGIEYLQQQDAKILRPANFPQHDPGKGHILFEKGSKRLLLINLVGQVFLDVQPNDPFAEIDKIMECYHRDDYDAVFVDFHAEATSEKEALGFYLDGRVSAIVGTHTHVATADQYVMPKGTAFCCDAGMVGAQDAIIGGEKEPILKKFLTQMPLHFEPPKNGKTLINALLIDVDPKTKLAVHIERVDRECEV